MDKLKEKIDSLNNVKILLESNEISGIKDAMEVWKNMELLNPWYVINEKNNCIKLSWCDKSPIENNCIVVTWDENYNSCKLLIYGKIQIFNNNKIKIIDLDKKNILELENYINEYGFLNYTVKEEDKFVSTCAGTGECKNLEIEVKYRNSYNEVSNCAEKMSILYNFSDLIYKLFEENIKIAKSTIA